MKVPIDHKAGQYASELFEDLVYALLADIWGHDSISRHFVLTDGQSVDLLLEVGGGKFEIIETKHPYTDTPSYGINRTVRRLKDIYSRSALKDRITKIVLVLSIEIPSRNTPELETAKQFFANDSVEFEVWDSRYLKSRLKAGLRVSLPSFSIANLEKALGKESGDRKHTYVLPTGEKADVVVVCADFCSYSKFVHASGGNFDLITSIMARFYREIRDIVQKHNGVLDKFMGDAILGYWFGEDQKQRSESLNSCVKGMIGIALKLSEEWQQLLDLYVTPTGLRVGAAIGSVLFIPEHPDGKGGNLVHAIGENINMATRLQALAEPNSFVISNRLRSEEFLQDSAFEELPPQTLKNIGEVVSWRKRITGPS